MWLDNWPAQFDLKNVDWVIKSPNQPPNNKQNVTL